MTAQQAAACRRHLERHQVDHGGSLGETDRFKSHLLFKWLADLVRRPDLLDAVEPLIGPDLLVWGTDWWIKEPRSATFVSWHQDNQYWGLDTTKLVTVGLVLSPSTMESGCVRVVPGSHLGPGLAHADTHAADNMLTRGQTIEGIAETEAVPFELRARRGIDLRVRDRPRVGPQPQPPS